MGYIRTVTSINIKLGYVIYREILENEWRGKDFIKE